MARGIATLSVQEVINWAKEREDENLFHLTKNNCESFVMWCLCGLKISLQVTPLRKALCGIGSGILRSIWHCLQQSFKVGAEALDDLPAAIGRGAKRSAVGQIPRSYFKGWTWGRRSSNCDSRGSYGGM